MTGSLGDSACILISYKKSHPFAVALLQFPHLRGLFHSEVNLIAVLPHHLEQHITIKYLQKSW